MSVKLWSQRGIQRDPTLIGLRLRWTIFHVVIGVRANMGLANNNTNTNISSKPDLIPLYLHPNINHRYYYSYIADIWPLTDIFSDTDINIYIVCWYLCVSIGRFISLTDQEVQVCTLFCVKWVVDLLSFSCQFYND